MSLADVVRNAVAIADNVTKSLQADVLHEAWIGFQGDYAEPKYAPPITRQAIVEFKQRLRRMTDGQEIMQQASITFIKPFAANGADTRREPIDPRDRFTLPNGYIGPILNVEGLIDSGTDAPFTLEVILG